MPTKKLQYTELTKSYLNHVIEDWSWLDNDQGGEPAVPLSQVFTLLKQAKVDREPPDKIPETYYVPDDYSKKDMRMGKIVPLGEILHDCRCVVILGGPGSGKSTTLQYVGFCTAKGSEEVNDKLKTKLDLIPVKIHLTACWDKIQIKEDLPLKSALIGEIANRIGNKEKADTLYDHWRNNKKLLILLDAMDETGDPRDIFKKINSFARAAENQHVKIIVASRPTGYSPLREGIFTEYFIQPIEKTDEQILFLSGWLKIVSPLSEAETRAKDIITQIGDQNALARFLNNPLLLRMIAEICAESNGNFNIAIQNRSSLYNAWIETLWKKAIKRGAREEEKQKAFESLEIIAWARHVNQDYNVESNEILLREKMGVLSRTKDNIIVFSHMTIQEYYVSRRLLRAWKENRRGCWGFIRDRYTLLKWREPFLLLFGELDIKDSEYLLKKILSIIGYNEEYEDLRKELLNELTMEFSISFVSDLFHWGKNKNIIRQFSVILMDRLGVEALSDLRQALSDPSELVRSSAAEAMGKIGLEVLPDLRRALGDPNKDVRLSAAEAMGKIGIEALPNLRQALNDSNDLVSSSAAEAMGFIGIEALPDLRLALNGPSENVRCSAAKAIGKIGIEALPDLRLAFNDPNHFVRDAAIQGMGNIGIKTLSDLRQALNDPVSLVRFSAVHMMVKIGKEAIPAMCKAVYDPHYVIRYVVVSTIGIIGKKALPYLRRALNDPCEDVRASAAKAMGMVGIEALPDLHQILNNSSEYVRSSAAKAMGEIGKEAFPALCQALNDPSERVRSSVAEAMGKIGKEALPDLHQALSDPSEFVRSSAAEAMGKIGVEALPDLRWALGDPDKDVRLSAAKAMGKIGIEALPDLCQAMNDPYEKVQFTIYLLIFQKLNSPHILTQNTKAYRKFVRQAKKEKNVYILDLIRAFESPYKDPFQKLWWEKVFIEVGKIIQWIFVSISIGLLLIISKVLLDWTAEIIINPEKLMGNNTFFLCFIFLWLLLAALVIGWITKIVDTYKKNL